MFTKGNILVYISVPPPDSQYRYIVFTKGNILVYISVPPPDSQYRYSVGKYNICVRALKAG